MITDWIVGTTGRVMKERTGWQLVLPPKTNVARRELASSTTRPRQPYRRLASPTDYVVLVDCPGGPNQVLAQNYLRVLCVLRARRWLALDDALAQVEGSYAASHIFKRNVFEPCLTHHRRELLLIRKL